jgi:hypothetical protein
MKTMNILAASLVLTTVSFACLAQEEEEQAPTVFTYATYFSCEGGKPSRADEIIAADAERMDGLVEDGLISGWGWLQHHTGGRWSRISYYQAASMDALLDAYDGIGEGRDEATAVEFSQICNAHDDYIWQVENGSRGDTRGAAGFSVYHTCDITREERADEIIAEHVAPILNGLVEDGKLTSWGWSSHVVGGKYRKLQTMTAADHKTLLAARGEAISAIYGDENEAGAELVGICGPHADYMWNILNETP